MSSKYAILLDGGFVTKKLQSKLGRFPTGADVGQDCQRISQHAHLANRDLLRIYFYEASPAKDRLTNFAVRRGEVVAHGWKLGNNAFKSMIKNPRPPSARDLVPDLEQKGVDLRIGLDIARLALRERVDIIVVVSGDSDLVPAFRF
ncbi:MAG: hypothetical protein DME26_22395 [Verrucomicrobia bacterium]|nr:MAG: hypothetical protein DME26_22395 [Verrucomicrobiota bacterium]